VKLAYTGPPEFDPGKPDFLKKPGVDYSKFDTQTWKDAHELLENGWYSVSNSHCRLARLPVGRQTATDAVLLLKDACRPHRPWDVDRWVDGMSIGSVASQYMRCYAPKEDKVSVSGNVYRAFRQLGGTTPNAFKCPEGRVHVPRDVVQALRDVEDEVEREAFGMFKGKLDGKAQHFLIALEKFRKKTGLCKRREDKAAIARRAKGGMQEYYDHGHPTSMPSLTAERGVLEDGFRIVMRHCSNAQFLARLGEDDMVLVREFCTRAEGY
jgi:hypothetical protein